MKPTAFERDDKIYLIAPVVPHRPTQNEIEEYAFGKTLVDDLKRSAPNENIAWFGGHYVEADQPNLNGAMWLGDDLAIASITPVMMPVTVMHDPRTAVGVIAHAELLLPPDVPRAKIDTALGLWKHRFPEAVQEAEANYSSGTLFQSMECHAPRYECSECRMPFMKLRDGAEKDQWCEHLKASNPSGGYTAKDATPRGNHDASRILRNVTFTGTGLIFGSRGGKGADPLANLEAFQDEVAEFHAGRSEPPKKSRSTSRRKRIMEIDDREYADLIAAKSERDSLKGRVGDLEVEAAKVPDLHRQIETTEAEKVKAEGERDAAAAKVQEAEERANKQTLRDERWEKLGSGFTAKIDGMPTTKANLLRDAEGLDENAWDARLKEVEEATATKRDAKKDGDDDKGGKGDDDAGDRENAIFQQEEVARFQGGGGAASSRVQTPTERRSVMAGLLKPPAKK